jgi:hypothetical protein
MKAAIFEARRGRASAATWSLFVVSGAIFGHSTLSAAQDRPPAAAPAPAPIAPREEKPGDNKPARDNRPREGRRVADRAFAGLMFLANITRADKEPVFVDLDTHRWMTPPPDLLVPENQGKPIDQWVFSKSLHLWIHRSGIDLAVQTDGHSLTVLGFDLRAGDSFPVNERKSEAAIADLVAPSPADAAHWITLNLKIARQNIFRRTPFITREGGLGTFCFQVSGVLGPNTIRVDHELTRAPDVSKLTGQPVDSAYEPPILSSLPPDLLVDVSNSKLRLRVPDRPSQIELGTDQVIVGELSKPELRATRLHTGRLEIDAGAGEVVVRGRQKATLRRVGDRVEIGFDKPRARGRYERDPDKRVAQAPQFTLLISAMKVAHEDSFEWTTVKPSPELLKKRADERRKRREAGEALYAELAAKHGYSLAPGQFMKRIPTPFPPARDEYWRVTRPDQFFYLSPDGGRGPEVVSYRWDGKSLQEGPDGFGKVWSLSDVAHVLHKLRPQQMSGPKSLLATPLPGDWIYREGITDEIFVAQLEPILRKEFKLPIHLDFREVPRDVYVARGTWHMTPLAGSRVPRGVVEIYANVRGMMPSGAGGDFAEFLRWVGQWTDTPVVSDVAEPPKRVVWRQNGPPFAYDRETTPLLLHNIEVQTGLKFTKETRPVKLLFVEQKAL